MKANGAKRKIFSDAVDLLAGHNRQVAGRLAGLTEIPAIVKTDLTEEDAYVYVIETNVIQRGFAELLPSEKAAGLAERYEKVSSQGRRNDILEEIARLNGQDTAGTCGHDVQTDSAENPLFKRFVAALKDILPQ